MSDYHSIRKRQSKHELTGEKRALQDKGEGIQYEGTKLAADKAALDELRAMIEASDLPEDVKQQEMAELHKQETVLRQQWEEDVENPEKALERDLDDLAQENRALSEEAAKNEQRIGEVESGLQSNMDASALREAQRAQRESADFFANESEETKRQEEDHKRGLDEIRNMLG